jgi:hypothetical protein
MQKGVVANSSVPPKAYISTVVNTASAAKQENLISKTLQSGFDDRLIKILANYLGRKVDQADTLNSLKLLNQDVKNA